VADFCLWPTTALGLRPSRQVEIGQKLPFQQCATAQPHAVAAAVRLRWPLGTLNISSVVEGQRSLRQRLQYGRVIDQDGAKAVSPCAGQSGCVRSDVTHSH